MARAFLKVLFIYALWFPLIYFFFFGACWSNGDVKTWLKSSSFAEFARFLTAWGLVWQAALKTTKVKIDLWTDIDMLLMVGRSNRGGICHANCWYVKAYNKCLKDKNKESSYLKYWDVNNICAWTMS